MTRILVHRGSSGSSSSTSQNRPSTSSSLPSSSSSSYNTEVVSDAKDEEGREEVQEQHTVDEFREDSVIVGDMGIKSDELAPERKMINQNDDDGIIDAEKVGDVNFVCSGGTRTGLSGLKIVGEENEGLVADPLQSTTGCSYPPPPRVPPPPPPPVPPPKASSANSNLRRSTSGSLNAARIGSSRRAALWPPVSTRTSPTGSRPSSPRSHCESEGYNSADEQGPFVGPTYDDAERERKFEIDIRRAKGLEVKKMLEDGNCLFRAVADQVYGDSELNDLVRQMCVDYMEKERDHFSQFITEGFTSYCKRKRRDKVYGNNVEIQALCEMYNRPIHIYSYSAEPMNTFHRGYTTDVPPIRLSYHHRNHYNSLVDPRRLTIGAGLGFSCLKGRNVNQDQVKAAISAQQDQQIDNALLAEGRFYSDLELTEREIESMVMEASRAEYIANENSKQQISHKDSSTSAAEPSSSGARSSGCENGQEVSHNLSPPESVLSSSMQMVLSMGFSYMQAVEAYSIFGDDVDAMICYLLETTTATTSRRKGKATE